MLRSAIVTALSSGGTLRRAGKRRRRTTGSRTKAQRQIRLLLLLPLLPVIVLLRLLRGITASLLRAGRRHRRAAGGVSEPLRTEAPPETGAFLRERAEIVLNIDRLKHAQIRGSRHARKRHRRLVQIHPGLIEQAAHLVHHQVAGGRGIGVLHGFKNRAVLSVQALHGAAPQRHTPRQRQQSIEGRLTDSDQQPSNQLVIGKATQLQVEIQVQVKELPDRVPTLLHLLQQLIHFIEISDAGVNIGNTPAFKKHMGLHQVTFRVARNSHVQAQRLGCRHRRLLIQVSDDLFALTGV